MDRIRCLYDIGTDGVWELRANHYYQVLERDEYSKKIKVMNELNMPLWYSEVFFEL